MTSYFRGNGGICWQLYGPGTPLTPLPIPELDISYPTGIQVGDFLVVMSYRYIIDSSIDTSHWHAMGSPGGYLYPGQVGHLAFWAIADAGDVGAGQLHTQISWTRDEYHQHAVHGLMCAWKPRIGFDPDVFFVSYRGEASMPWPAWSGMSGDLSMAVGLGGTNYHTPPYQPPTFSWGAYTEEFQAQDSLTFSDMSLLGGAVDTTENAAYGAASYPMTDGTVASTSFATSTDDPAGGDGRFFQMLNAGTTVETVGYWGILAVPV